MKFIRKIVTLFITVVFLASVAIGLGVIYAVRNVNVTLISYAEDETAAKENIAKIKSDILGGVRGTVISLINEEKLAKTVEGDKYVIESLQKVYPCTLNITVRERVELFACHDGEIINIYDERGTFTRTVAGDDETAAEEIAKLVILENAKTPADFESVAAACSAFKKQFSSFGSICDKVILSRAQAQLATDRITFVLKSGLKIELQDFGVFTEAKAKAAYLKFEDLSGAQKLEGTIFSFAPTDSEETVRATYSREG